MRILFVSAVYPGRLGAMASWLAKEHQVLYASYRVLSHSPSGSLQRIILKNPPRRTDSSDSFGLWENILKCGRDARGAFESIKYSGFEPDMIFYCLADGGSFFLPDVFPNSFLVGFAAPFSETSFQIKTTRIMAQSVSFIKSRRFYAFSRKDRESFPPLVAANMGLAPIIVDSSPLHPVEFNSSSPLLIFPLSASAISEEFWQLLVKILSQCPACRAAIFSSRKAGSHIENLRQTLPPLTQERLLLALNVDARRKNLSSSSLIILPDKRDLRELYEYAATGVPIAYAGTAPADIEKLLVKLPRSDTGKVNTIMEALKSSQKLQEQGRTLAEKVRLEHSADRVMPEFFGGICKAWQGGRE